MHILILVAMAVSLIIGLTYTVVLNEKIYNDDELIEQKH